MPIGKPDTLAEKLDFIKGQPKDISIYYTSDGSPVVTTGWLVEGILRWSDGSVTLSGDSDLTVDAAGHITGQVQPEDFTDMPRGRHSDLIVHLWPSAGAEPYTIIVPIEHWVVPTA